MANIECKDCGDLVDVEARTVTLPFVCKWCEESFTPAAAETDDGLVYRVEPAGTLECSDEFEESESLDQFELDTKLIEDLSNQLAEANKRIKSLENRLNYCKKIYSRLYKDFSELETRYFIERDKTWWERLWA